MSTRPSMPKAGSAKFFFALDGDELDDHRGQNLMQYIEGAVEGVEHVSRTGIFTYDVTVGDSALANIRDLRIAVIKAAYDYLVSLGSPAPTR